MTLNEITLTLTAMSAFGALGAAVAAWLSARATTRATEAQLFSSHFAVYGTPEMLRSLRILRLWKSDNGEEFEVKWKIALDAGEAKAHDVDQARRQVKFYFFRALRLHEAGYVSKRFLKELAAVDGVNILYDIVEPLEYALNASYDRSSFEKLRRLCDRTRTGLLIAPVPVAAEPPIAAHEQGGG